MILSMFFDDFHDVFSMIFMTLFVDFLDFFDDFVDLLDDFLDLGCFLGHLSSIIPAFVWPLPGPPGPSYGQSLPGAG